MMSRRQLVTTTSASLVVLGLGRAGAAPVARPPIGAGPALDPERTIAAHPMSQALEEAPWRDGLAAALGLPRPIQFLVRVGYVDRYPEPVSPRRALASFVNV